jgi:hypothetical protein
VSSASWRLLTWKGPSNPEAVILSSVEILERPRNPRQVPSPALSQVCRLVHPPNSSPSSVPRAGPSASSNSSPSASASPSTELSGSPSVDPSSLPSSEPSASPSADRSFSHSSDASAVPSPSTAP